MNPSDPYFVDHVVSIVLLVIVVGGIVWSYRSHKD